MSTTPTDAAQAQAESVKSVVATSLEAFQKLAALNLETAKGSLGAVAGQLKNLMATRDVKGLTELASGWVKPGAEAVVTYARAVQAATAESSSELAAQVKARLDTTTQQLVTNLESMMKGAPAGSEAMVTLVKEAIAVANSSYEQLNAASKKLVEAGLETLSTVAGGKKS
jgi:phasin family protein